MRSDIILAGALILATASAAHAEGWCGYAAREKSLIECGYSSATECESAIGKGGMCFIDPDYAVNVKRTAPVPAMPAIAAKLSAGRG